MTNQISIVTAIILAALFMVDLLFFGGSNLLFLLRKLSELVEWLAFWR